MASLLDLFADDTQNQGGTPTGFMAGLYGDSLSPAQQKSALGLALLQAGASLAQASQGRPGQGAPSLGQIAGAGMQGFAGGLQGAAQNSMTVNALQGQGVLRRAQAQKAEIDAVKEQDQILARIKFSQGDRTPEVFAAAFPEEYAKAQLDMLTGPTKALQGKGLMMDAQGRVVPMPGFAESQAQIAGAEQAAKSGQQFYAIQPGGALVSPSGGGGGGGVPQQSAAMPGQLGAAITRNATAAGVPPQLLAAVVQAESSSRIDVPDSPKGAIGLTQLMPETAKGLGVDPRDPEQNLRGGAQFLSQLRQKYGRDDFALAAYNWGPTNVDRWIATGADPAKLPADTRQYVSRVLSGAPQAAGGAQRATTVYQSGSPAPGTQEGKWDQTMGEELAKRFLGTQDAVKAQRQQLNRLETLSSLLSNIETGKMGDLKLELKRGLQAVGLDLNALGLTDNVGPQEAARALSNQFALEMRNPAGGAGMPGALSDKDREFLMSQVPGLAMTSAGRALLVDAQRRLLKRADAEAQLWRKYRRERGGRVDEGIYDALDELSKQDVFDADFLDKVNRAVGAAPTTTKALPPPPQGFSIMPAPGAM